MRVYIDSDVLIWHLRGEEKARRTLRALHSDSSCQLWTGAMQRAEVVFFMRPGEEEDTLLFLSYFRTESVGQALVDQAGALYRRWHPSHGIDVNDAFLAASALHSGGKVVCLNTRHYPMPEISVERAW